MRVLVNCAKPEGVSVILGFGFCWKGLSTNFLEIEAKP